jgi:hypothetical protein
MHAVAPASETAAGICAQQLFRLRINKISKLKKQCCGSGSGRIRTFLIGSGSGRLGPDPDPDPGLNK